MPVINIVLNVAGWLYSLLVALGEFALMTVEEYFSTTSIMILNPFNGSEVEILAGNWFNSDWNIWTWIVDTFLDWIPVVSTDMYVFEMLLIAIASVSVVLLYLGFVKKVVMPLFYDE